MVYSNKFIVAVKNNGKILREFNNNEVRLPFGSDYTLLLKNKDLFRKVRVDITVDGSDVLDGNSLVLNPDSSTELKGFIKGTSVRNKFRFIEKTKEISKYRGDREEDGLVEVKYVFEKNTILQQDSSWSIGWPTYWHYPPTYTFGTGDPVCQELRATSVACSCNANDSGITVPGQLTNQEFTQGSFGEPDGWPQNIIIHLKGVIENKTSYKAKKVIKPTTVKSRLTCPTCGRRWKSSMIYCGKCSTYLH